ncbi:hypothetical protein EfmJHP38_04040 [Enterococcus faecium]|nr:hypothetical protein EfmJHP38_04040 [Enterococcus faecium]
METTDTLLQLLQEAHKTNQAQQQTIQNLTTEIQLLNEKVNYLTNKLFGPAGLMASNVQKGYVDDNTKQIRKSIVFGALIGAL